MARDNANDAAGSSCTGPDDAMTLLMMEVMKNMLESQKEQMEAQAEQNRLLREGFALAQEIARTAIEKTTAPKEQKVGTVSDFRRLAPKAFNGKIKPLKAEQ